MAGKNLDYNFLLDCNFDSTSACSSAVDYYILAVDRSNSAAGCNFVGIVGLDYTARWDRTTAQKDHNIHLAAVADSLAAGRYSTAAAHYSIADSGN